MLLQDMQKTTTRIVVVSTATAGIGTQTAQGGRGLPCNMACAQQGSIVHLGRAIHVQLRRWPIIRTVRTMQLGKAYMVGDWS